MGAAQSAGDRLFGGGFRAFRRGIHAERAGERDDRADQAQRVRIAGGRGHDQGSIDFDGAETATPNMAKGRSAGAEIVKRDSDR